MAAYHGRAYGAVSTHPADSATVTAATSARHRAVPADADAGSSRRRSTRTPSASPSTSASGVTTGLSRSFATRSTALTIARHGDAIEV